MSTALRHANYHTLLSAIVLALGLCSPLATLRGSTSGYDASSLKASSPHAQPPVANGVPAYICLEISAISPRVKAYCQAWSSLEYTFRPRCVGRSAPPIRICIITRPLSSRRHLHHLPLPPFPPIILSLSSPSSSIVVLLSSPCSVLRSPSTSFFTHHVPSSVLLPAQPTHRDVQDQQWTCKVLQFGPCGKRRTDRTDLGTMRATHLGPCKRHGTRLRPCKRRTDETCKRLRDERCKRRPWAWLAKDGRDVQDKRRMDRTSSRFSEDLLGPSTLLVTRAFFIFDPSAFIPVFPFASSSSTIDVTFLTYADVGDMHTKKRDLTGHRNARATRPRSTSASERSKCKTNLLRLSSVWCPVLALRVPANLQAGPIVER